MQIFFLGRWGRVCTRLSDLAFYHHRVETAGTTSTVVCRQLGDLKAIPTRQFLYYSANYSTDLIWLDVTCNGSETHLTQCSNLGLGVHNCYNENLAVTCSSKL